jgi:hypothetical protein
VKPTSPRHVEHFLGEEDAMAGKTGSSSKHSANTGGKAGNASGRARRESRGDSAGTKGQGKHPPPLTRATQTEKKRRSRIDVGPGKRPSDRG